MRASQGDFCSGPPQHCISLYRILLQSLPRRRNLILVPATPFTRKPSLAAPEAGRAERSSICAGQNEEQPTDMRSRCRLASLMRATAGERSTLWKISEPLAQRKTTWSVCLNKLFNPAQQTCKLKAKRILNWKQTASCRKHGWLARVSA